MVISEEKKMKLRFFGHAMWGISTDKCNIIIDPFTDIGYPMPTDLTANIVISSHEHFDHNNFKLIIPPFKKINQIGKYQVEDVNVKLIEASHGKLDGKNLGDTYICLINIEGVSILHCGDLGEIPNSNVLNEIKDVDILLVPIGGKYTIDAEQAKELVERIKPKLVFPMHYRVECSKVDIIDTIDPFLVLYPNTKKIDSNIYEVDKDMLKKGELNIITLNYE